jgi:phage-related minor tail protein
MSKGSIKGITIEIEGKTSGLTKALRDADVALAKTEKALKEVEKALELDPSNVELAAQKEQLLADKAKITSDRLEVLKQVQKDALTQLDNGAEVSTSALAELSAEIVKTEKGLEGMDGAADEATDDLNKVGDSSDKASDKAGKLGAALQTAAKVAQTAFKAIAAAAGAAVGAVAAVGKGIVDVGKKLGQLSVDAASRADEILTESTISGISTDTFQELKYAAELVDTSVETIQGSLVKVTKSMASAKGGSKGMIENFKKLGVSVTDSAGNLRDSEDVFADVITALGGIDNEAEADALAMSVLGKSAGDLKPLIAAGGDALNQLRQEAHDVGYVMDSETLEGFGAFDDNIQKLKNGAEAAQNAIGGMMLPALTELSGEGVDLLGEFTNALNEANETGDYDTFAQKLSGMVTQAMDSITKNIGPIINTITTVINTVIQAVSQPEVLSGLVGMVTSIITTLNTSLLSPENITMLLGAAQQILQSLLDGLLANLDPILQSAIGIITTLVTALLNPDILSSLLEAAIQIILSLVGALNEALPELVPVAIEAIMTLVNALLEPSTLKSLIEAGIKILLAVVKGIADALPELIPTIIEAIGVIVETLLDNLPEIITAAIQIIMALISGLIQALPNIIAQGPKFLSAIQQCLADIPGKIVEMATGWGSDLISNFVKGFKDNMDKLKNGVKGIASTIASYIHFSVPDEGPLSDFDKSGGDMIDVFTQGMYSQMGTLKTALNRTAGVIANGMQPDYTMQLAGISGQLAGMNRDQQIVIPVSIGSDRLGVAMAKAQNNTNYRSGGH